MGRQKAYRFSLVKNLLKSLDDSERYNSGLQTYFCFKLFCRFFLDSMHCHTKRANILLSKKVTSHLC